MPIILDTLADGRTFLELQNEALSDDFDPSKYRDLVKVWINEALRKVARRVKSLQHDATQSITTAAGIAAYTLDNDVTRIRWVVDTELRLELDEVTLRDFDGLSSASGRPTLFALSSAGFVLWPTPDGVYDIDARYWAAAIALVNDEDTPASFGLTDDYVDLLPTYARARLFRAEDDFEAAATYMAEFEAGLTRAKSDLERPSSAGRRQVPGMFAGRRGPSFQRPSR